MFREVPKDLDYPTAEREVLSFWDDRKIYEQSLARRRGAPRFVFYEGPPTANGLPHPGHCLTRAVKDLFPRYKTMRGYLCERKAGWDTHGLPVEVEVCKELGIHSKEEIERYGMEPFIKKCQQSVFRYVKEWETITRRLGFWVNLEEAYVTYHQRYVESVWWSLKTLFDAGLLYQGHKIVWWWAQGGTALSSGEVGQGYREVADPSVYVRFPLVDEARTSLLVWTTTPWTLLSNHFAAVHADLEYALVEDADHNERFYVAAALVEALAKKSKRPLTEITRVRGAELVGRSYVPPFDFAHRDLGARRAKLRAGGDATIGWRVLAASFVTIDSGTGLVHEAPAFGEVDFELWQAERSRFVDPDSVPLLCLVAPNGRFTAEAGERYSGRWVKEADKDIIRDLKERGLLFHHEQYLHEYPFCWRADEDPLIQYPRSSWFIRTTQFVDQMLANNHEINWLPDHIRDGRFGKFLESNVDWTLSRERYWGTPLPIWVCEATGFMEAVAGYDELLAKPGVTGTEVWAAALAADPTLCQDLKVHRPYIDAVTYNSPKSKGARMRRVPDVIDCWYDSGAMPFAQWGFPHQNGERFRAQFPCDFISEALDQTRGWFYSLVAIGTLLFGARGVARAAVAAGPTPDSGSVWPVPFRNCIVLGLLKGEDGLKMSKSKRNYSPPEEILNKQGADAMRWLFFCGQPPWTSILFQERAIAEGQREFLIRLYNVYSFLVIYANIDGWQPTARFALIPEPDRRALSELDRWILSELQVTTRAVREALDRYDSFVAARALNEFVDSVSNWYLRRSRDRIWRSGLDADKRAAYETLHGCLVSTALLAAPFVPFFAETLYQNLVRSRGDAETGAPESVHLCDYPAPLEAWIDESLSRAMKAARDVASAGRAVRAASKLRVRQPLALAEVVVANQAQANELTRVVELIAEELNVKRVEFTTAGEEYVEYLVKPNFRSIGPKHGKLAPQIQKTLKEHPDPARLRRALAEAGGVDIEVAGQAIPLSAEDVQIDLIAKPGWAAAQAGAVVVVLRTELDADLRLEGVARELVHHVQSARKELGLRYEQRIELAIAGGAAVAAAVLRFKAYIAGETLATRLGSVPIAGSEPRAVDLDGEATQIWINPE
ncbi:MAG: isoleucine--tRNA ligase [Planctomycetota bacterium]